MCCGVVARCASYDVHLTTPIYINVKVKCSRYTTGVAQRVDRGIALFFHDRGTRRGWVVTSMPRPHFALGERPGNHFTGGWVGPSAGLDGGRSRPLRHSIPDRPGRSQSLYWLSYRASEIQIIVKILVVILYKTFYYDKVQLWYFTCWVLNMITKLLFVLAGRSVFDIWWWTLWARIQKIGKLSLFL